MKKCVYIVGTADTKIKELQWIKHCLHSHGINSYIVDVSTRPVVVDSSVDVSSTDLLGRYPECAGMVQSGERVLANSGMSMALTCFLKDAKDISGIIGIGGSSGTSIVTHAMQSLPIGLPKIMVSTMASGDVKVYVGCSDIAMLYPVTDLQGLNVVTRTMRCTGNSGHCHLFFY